MEQFKKNMIFIDKNGRYKLSMSHSTNKDKTEYEHSYINLDLYNDDLKKQIKNKDIVCLKDYWLDFYYSKSQKKKKYPNPTFVIKCKDLEILTK